MGRKNIRSEQERNISKDESVVEEMQESKRVKSGKSTYDIRDNEKEDSNCSEFDEMKACYELQWPRQSICDFKRAALCTFLTRHPSGVEALAFAHDGKWLAVGRSDGQVDIYEVGIQRVLLMSLPGGINRAPRALAWIRKTQCTSNISLFNYRLFAATLHGMILEWDLSTETIIRESPSYGGAIFGACISDELGLLVIATDDGGARLFKLRSDTDTEDPSEILALWKSMSRHSGRLLCVCVYDNNWVYGGTASSTILRWNMKTGNIESKMATSTGPSKSSAGREILEKTKGQRRGEQDTELETPVWSVVALRKCGVIVSGDSLGFVIVWDAVTSTALKIFHPHEADALSVCGSDSVFFSVGVDGRLNIFSLSKGKDWIHHRTCYPHSSDIRTVAVSPCGLLVATGSADCKVKVIDVTELSHPHIVQLPNISAAIASSWVVYCECVGVLMMVLPNEVEIWHFTNEERKTEVSLPLLPVKDFNPVLFATLALNDGPRDQANVRCGAISDDGSLIAVSNDSGTRLFSLKLQEEAIETVASAKLRRQICTAMTFTPVENGRKYLVCGVVGHTDKRKQEFFSEKRISNCVELQVWDLESHTITHAVDKLALAIHRIKVSCDGKWVATVSCGGVATLYALDTLKLKFKVDQFPKVGTEGLPGFCGALAFSPNSKYVCVLRRDPGAYMIIATSTGSMLTSESVKPSFNVFDDGEIFNMVNVSADIGDVGDVCWMESKPNISESNKNIYKKLPRGSPLADFVIDQKRPMQTLLFKTLASIGTTRFQLATRNRRKSHVEFKTSCKLNPCRTRTQGWNQDILQVFVPTDSDKIGRLMIMSQPRQAPQPSPTYRSCGFGLTNTSQNAGAKNCFKDHCDRALLQGKK